MKTKLDQQAFEAFAKCYPHEAYAKWPDRFWKYFHKGTDDKQNEDEEIINGHQGPERRGMKRKQLYSVKWKQNGRWMKSVDIFTSREKAKERAELIGGTGNIIFKLPSAINWRRRALAYQNIIKRARQVSEADQAWKIKYILAEADEVDKEIK